MGVQKEIITRTPAFLGTVEVTDASGSTTEVAMQGATGALAIGVPGNIYDASPARIHTESLTEDADCGTFVAGKGVIVNPREYALRGADNDPLAPSLTLVAGTPASFMTFGHVVVKMKEVANIIADSGKMSGSVIVAPFYSDAGTYAVGDIVYKEGKFQKCTTAGTGTAAVFADAGDADLGDKVCVIEVNGLN